MQHSVVSRDQWIEARKELLAQEKELTRQSDALAQKRQALPWVRVEESYRFDTAQGRMTLAELFQGRSQLVVYHFMFGPDYAAGCPSCSMIADGFNGLEVHLAHHDVMLWAVSRAPLAKLQAYQQRMGWSFPWASTSDTTFNFDFDVSFTKKQQFEEGIQYNYRREPVMPPEGKSGDEIPSRKTPEGPALFALMSGTDVATYTRERPGMSSFILEDGVVYHTYSTFARGLDALWGSYQWLDRAPKGRNESGIWWKRHDEYETPSPVGARA